MITLRDALVSRGPVLIAMPMTKSECADKLAILGWDNQSTAARALGVQRETVSRWVNGHAHVPSIIAAVLRYACLQLKD